MSSTGLEEVINVGYDHTAGKYYSLAATTIFFYDFLLTLADEIKYAWHGRKSWVFVIFLANRYLPIGYQLWSLYVSYNTTFHQQLYERDSVTPSNHQISHPCCRCDRTAFFEVLVTVETTLLAQVVLTLRIYAVTSKNRILASCLGLITISQFVLGLYLTVYAATSGSLPILPVPLPIYMLCVFVGPRFAGIAFPTISLVYDLLAFSVIVYLVVRSNVYYKVPIPSLLKTIARDATYYFLVIFTSHLVLVMFLLFASLRIKLLPASGNVVFLPVMITRLMLSLKKANASQEYAWSLGEPTTHTTMRFAEGRGGISTRDETCLDTFPSTQEGTRSQA